MLLFYKGRKILHELDGLTELLAPGKVAEPAGGAVMAELDAKSQTHSFAVIARFENQTHSDASMPTLNFKIQSGLRQPV